jgi:hypothetical protein
MLRFRVEHLRQTDPRSRDVEDRGDELALLVYELLDAHDDTVRLGDEHENDLRWRAHLDYLRGLQRVGREALARVTAGDFVTQFRLPTGQE